MLSHFWGSLHNIACGFCFNCSRGYTNACLTANPEAPTAGYGYAGMGPHRGGQAEFLRVPFADLNCLKLPGKPGDEFEDDFVLLADIFPTGWRAAVLANVKSGDSVAVFGAGPVGLLSAYSAFFKGAAEVYVVDRAPDRLRRAESIGAAAVDFTKGDPVEQIRDLRARNRKRHQALRPGEEKMARVNCAIDAVGYQALSQSNPETEDPMATVRQIAELVNPTGSVGLIGVYFDEDPGGVDKHAKKGEFLFPLGLPGNNHVAEIRVVFLHRSLALPAGHAFVPKFAPVVRAGGVSWCERLTPAAPSVDSQTRATPPYTFVVMAILMLVLRVTAITAMATNIFVEPGFDGVRPRNRGGLFRGKRR